MNQSAQAARLIKYLEYIRARPALYVGPDLLAIEPFLEGFRCASAALGLTSTNHDLRQAIWQQHHWRYSPRGWLAMQDRGLDAAAIADALLRIEIDVWKELYHVTDAMVVEAELPFERSSRHHDLI